jgi:hypothetical protein
MEENSVPLKQYPRPPAGSVDAVRATFTDSGADWPVAADRSGYVRALRFAVSNENRQSATGQIESWSLSVTPTLP